MSNTVSGIDALFYTDAFEIYRQDERDRDAKNNSKGLRKVGGGPWLGGKNPTDNYDDDGSPAGQSKQNNIMTSDKHYTTADVPLRAEDLIQYTASGEWFTVAGAPKIWPAFGGLNAYQKVYLTTTKKPKVLAGTWNV